MIRRPPRSTLDRSSAASDLYKRQQLRKGSKLTSCIAVKIRYADMNTHTKQLRIGYTACDHIILPSIHELFRTLYDRRQRIRLIGVRYSHLVGGGHQMDAFTDTQEAMNLYQAMDKVRKRFGDRVVMRAAGMEGVSYTHIRAHKTVTESACPLLL